MIAVFVINNKYGPITKESDCILTSWKITVRREIVNVLLFEDESEFCTWKRAEWHKRYLGYEFEIHEIEDMRQSQNEHTCYITKDFRCSECGHQFPYGNCEPYETEDGRTTYKSLGYFKCIHDEYCPHCTARIVEE